VLLWPPSHTHTHTRTHNTGEVLVSKLCKYGHPVHGRLEIPTCRWRSIGEGVDIHCIRKSIVVLNVFSRKRGGGGGRGRAESSGSIGFWVSDD
jgi:hypothetical protein